MSYSLSYINHEVKKSPKNFAIHCDEIYRERIKTAADMICDNKDKSPIVLLSGPSGSGKTTTAKKLEEELEKRGINTHAVSMDNYFVTFDPKTAPRTPDGEVDFESPLCMDMDLLNEHFLALTNGEEIKIPYYVFSRQKRSATQFTPMKLGKNEIAIFEGIHALSDPITDKNPDAFKLYISVDSNIEENDRVYFHRNWIRIARRVVRDNNFRGADALMTLNMWPNVRRGEELYILPYKDKAFLKLDSSLPYEIPVLKPFAKPLLEKAEGNALADEIDMMLSSLELFPEMSTEYVAEDSLLREFIGGGIYSY